MKLFKRKPPSPFTLRQRVTGEARIAMQDKDINSLRTLSSLMESLDSPPLSTSHPLRGVASHLKKHILHDSKEESFMKNISRLEEYLSQESEERKEVFASYPLEDEQVALSPENYQNLQTSLRLINLQYYCKNLMEVEEHDPIVPESTAPCHVKYVIDSFLLGSGAERTSGHLRVIGQGNIPFTQALLQSSYYSLLEPEVATVSEASQAILESSKDHVKALKKVAPIYLLDKLELNTKSRCVFAWSDPAYKGYEPLSDDQVVMAENILAGNYVFFPESASVGKQFIEKYISDRQVLYSEINENRSNMKYGAVFFVITCIVDGILGVI